MHLNHLSLTNFRNYVRLELDLPLGIIVLQGENAQGKTNLLEAIYYLATSRSPHASTDRHLINWLADKEDIPFARLAAQVQRSDATHRVEITLVKTIQPNDTAETAPLRRSFKLDGAKKRAISLLGQLNTVLFLPEDISLIPGAPGGRRRHLDVTICQFDPQYCRSLQRYNQLLTRRNHLLRDLRARNGDPDQLTFWNQRLIEWGTYLIARRMLVLNRTAYYADRIHAELTGHEESLEIRYLPAVPLHSVCESLPHMSPPNGSPQEALPALLKQVSARFEAQLALRQRDEILRGVTLVGPHRDDVRFLSNGVDMGIYGSRGQQRTSALSLKLAEVQVMNEETGEMPVLLLDDVLSELDEARCQYLLDAVNAAPQVIITATDTSSYTPEFLSRALLWRVREGTIRKTMNHADPS